MKTWIKFKLTKVYQVNFVGRKEYHKEYRKDSLLKNLAH